MKITFFSTFFLTFFLIFHTLNDNNTFIKNVVETIRKSGKNPIFSGFFGIFLKFFYFPKKFFKIRESTEAAMRHFFATKTSQILVLDRFCDPGQCARDPQCVQSDTAGPKLC